MKQWDTHKIQSIQAWICQGELTEAGLIRLSQGLSISHRQAVEGLGIVLRFFARQAVRKGRISPQRLKKIRRFWKTADRGQIAEAISPYHQALSALPLYRESDAVTRRLLRRSAARYGKRHRLSPTETLRLWTPALPRPRRLFAWTLILPFLAGGIALGASLLPFSPAQTAIRLPLIVIGTFCGVLTVSMGLAKAMPTCPLPRLVEEGKQSLLWVTVGSYTQRREALAGLARHATLAKGEDCLLILSLPDGPLPLTPAEEEAIAGLAQQLEEIARRCECTVDLHILPRHYAPDAKPCRRYRSHASPREIREAIEQRLSDQPRHPDGICILPADGSLPRRGHRLASAALFHPLCPADVLVFPPADSSPLPFDRLSLRRTVLLQKYGAPADQTLYGIYRRDALSALAKGEQVRSGLAPLSLWRASGQHPRPIVRKAPTLLPFWQIALPLARLTLLTAAPLLGLSLPLTAVLWLFASADLVLCGLASLRIGHRFFTHTLPDWNALGTALLCRTVWPGKELSELWESHRVGIDWLCILPTASVWIFMGPPTAIVGLGWLIAPLLYGQKPRTARPSPALCKCCTVLATHLSPALMDKDQTSEFGGLSARMAACLAAVDLAVISPTMAEERIADHLCQLESYPTYRGLPLNERGDAVDSYAVCRHALCLAAVEGGLRARPTSPTGARLADRIAHLRAQMELSALIDRDGTVCQLLFPSGERRGKLTNYYSGAAIALCALALADGTEDLPLPGAPYRWIRGRRIPQSEGGELQDYLLTALWLPAKHRGMSTLMSALVRSACRRELPFSSLSTLCLALCYAPRKILPLLNRLIRSQSIPLPSPQEGAYAILGLAEAANPGRMEQRLRQIPALALLCPILYNPPDPILTDPPAPAPPAASPQPTVALFGDAACGLLTDCAGGLALWRDRPLLCPVFPGSFLTAGRGSGILLAKDDHLLPLILPPFAEDSPISARVTAIPGGQAICWQSAAAVGGEIRLLLSLPGQVELSTHAVTVMGKRCTALSVICSANLTLAIAFTGLAQAFAHADSAPFPRGEAGMMDLLGITPIPPSGKMDSPSCLLGGQITDPTFALVLLSAPTTHAALAALETVHLSDAPMIPPLRAPAPARSVCQWQIGQLFATGCIPAAGAVGGEALALQEALTLGASLLRQRGFPPSSAAPVALRVSRTHPASALMQALLAPPKPAGEVPLLPLHTVVDWSDGYPSVRRGRDLRLTEARYHSHGLDFVADPDGLILISFAGEAIPFSLCLTEGGRNLLIPAAARQVDYSLAEAIFRGDGFVLHAGPVPDLPLLALRLSADSGVIRLTFPTLPSPDRREEGTAFWHLPGGRIFFCRRLSEERDVLWLMGFLARGGDRLYYTAKSLTASMLARKLQDGQSRQAKLFSAPGGGDIHPALAHLKRIALLPGSAGRLLLTPLFAPAGAPAELIRAAQSAVPDLCLPMGFALYLACLPTDEPAHLRIPVAGGRASLYLLAVRTLERAMEEDPGHPFLPPLVRAFAGIAHRLGDRAGEEGCHAFLTDPPTLPPSGKALPALSVDWAKALLSDPLALIEAKNPFPDGLQAALIVLALTRLGEKI